METIYLDHCSTTPLHPGVAEAMAPFGHARFGNPASPHQAGRHARHALETARESIAGDLGAHPSEVAFTSGATEANNLAIFGLIGDPPGQLISSAIEHPSVSEPLRQLATRGFNVTYLPVDQEGITVDVGLETLASKDLRFVAVMLANNETGAVQPVARLVKQVLALPGSKRSFHCDGAQAVGKIPVSFGELGVTTLSLSSHKLRGPGGIGALLVSRGTRLKPLFWGGHQQQGLRPGTEPVSLVVGLASALRIACAELGARATRCMQLRTLFLERLTAEAGPLVLNGPRVGGLTHVLNVSFPGCAADVLLMKLDLAGVACSTGSACSSGSLLPSPVLQAMGCAPDVLRSAMRFSFSQDSGEKALLEAAHRIGKAVRELRAVTCEED